MKRVLVLIGLMVGCANPPAEIYAHCQRWSQNYLKFGAHVNPDAYREDLISTCMAMKKTPYEPQQVPISSVSAWDNPSVSESERMKIFGRDKANCIERGYVGQVSGGSSNAGVFGYGAIVSGNQSASYASAPVFNRELYMACMNGAGWELTDPTAR